MVTVLIAPGAIDQMGCGPKKGVSDRTPANSTRPKATPTQTTGMRSIDLRAQGWVSTSGSAASQATEKASDRSVRLAP